MKQGKKPTVAQCNFMQSKGLVPKNWLVCKDTPTIMVVKSRNKGQIRELDK